MKLRALSLEEFRCLCPKGRLAIRSVPSGQWVDHLAFATHSTSCSFLWWGVQEEVWLELPISMHASGAIQLSGVVTIGLAGYIAVLALLLYDWWHSIVEYVWATALASAEPNRMRRFVGSPWSNLKLRYVNMGSGWTLWAGSCCSSSR